MIDLPEFLSPETWESWTEYRLNEATRKKFGPAAQKMFLNKCKRLHADGYDVPALIEHACDVGWLTIWPNDQMKRKRQHRETTVTDLRIVETTDKETAQAHIAAMKQQARKA